MTYLYAAREEKAKNLGHAPGLAGAFYYHLDDPIVEVDRTVVAEEAEELQRSAMKLKGLACENPAVIAHIDATPGSKLTVLPLSKNKDGSFRESKMLVSEEHLESFADYAVWKMAHFADEIYGGQVTPNPYQYGNKSACTYWPIRQCAHLKPKFRAVK
jgi:ATP-dependent helicase/nuclease subunit B